MLIKILFECTRFFKLQHVVKIDAISIQIRRVLISGGLIPGCICLFTAGPLYPRLVYRDRPITGETYKNVCVCVCVCWGRGGGGGGGLKAQVYGICIETVKHSQFKEQRTEA